MTDEIRAFLQEEESREESRRYADKEKERKQVNEAIKKHLYEDKNDRENFKRKLKALGINIVERKNK